MVRYDASSHSHSFSHNTFIDSIHITLFFFYIIKWREFSETCNIQDVSMFVPMSGEHGGLACYFFATTSRVTFAVWFFGKAPDFHFFVRNMMQKCFWHQPCPCQFLHSLLQCQTCFALWGWSLHLQKVFISWYFVRYDSAGLSHSSPWFLILLLSSRLVSDLIVLGNPYAYIGIWGSFFFLCLLVVFIWNSFLRGFYFLGGCCFSCSLCHFFVFSRRTRRKVLN